MKIVLFLLTALSVQGGTWTALRAIKVHDAEFRVCYNVDPLDRWFHPGNSNVHYKARITIEHIQFFAHGGWQGPSYTENRQAIDSMDGTYVPEGCPDHDDPVVYVGTLMGWRFEGRTNSTLVYTNKPRNLDIDGKPITGWIITITNNGATASMPAFPTNWIFDNEEPAHMPATTNTTDIRLIDPFKNRVMMWIWWSTLAINLVMMGFSIVRLRKITKLLKHLQETGQL